MKRRWIIRGFFIGPLLLCAAAWTWSFGWEEAICYENSGGSRTYCVDIFRGQIRFMEDWVHNWSPEVQWSLSHRPASDPNIVTDVWMHKSNGGSRFFGFYYNNQWPITFALSVPLWFPTTSSAALLCLVWRKTRPKPHPKTAFPVEVKQTIGERTP